jgi:hypothetical protein
LYFVCRVGVLTSHAYRDKLSVSVRFSCAASLMYTARYVITGLHDTWVQTVCHKTRLPHYSHLSYMCRSVRLHTVLLHTLLNVLRSICKLYLIPSTQFCCTHCSRY